MNKIEFENLKASIKAYKDKKEQILEPLKQYREKVKSGEEDPYFEDLMISEVYFKLEKSLEYTNFNALAMKTANDSEFEKYFRSAFFEIFENKIINPSQL